MAAFFYYYHLAAPAVKRCCGLSQPYARWGDAWGTSWSTSWGEE